MTRSLPALLAFLAIGVGVVCAVAAPPFGIDIGVGERITAPRVVTASDHATGRPRAGDDVPTVTNLDPELRAAVRRAVDAAAVDGVGMRVTSGWRSADHQAELLEEAIEQYGSAAEAARWVASPETSRHVSGDAVDIGPYDAMDWLSRHGAAYGLCQIYGNEPWHFELRPAAPSTGCPQMFVDPTHDPRTQG